MNATYSPSLASEFTSELCLTLPNQFDIRSVPAVREQFEAALTTMATEVVLDFSAVEFIDSSAIGAVIFLFKRLRTDGRRLSLLQVNGQPWRTLLMLKVDKAIPFITKDES